MEEAMQGLNKKKLIGIVFAVLLMIGQNIFAATVEPTIQLNYHKGKNGNVKAEFLVNNLPDKTSAIQVQIPFNEDVIKSNFGITWSKDLDPNAYKTMKIIESGMDSNEVILYLVSDVSLVLNGNVKVGTISFQSNKEVSALITDIGHIKILQENMKPIEVKCKIILKDITSEEDNNGSGGDSDNDGSTDDDSDNEQPKVEVISWKEMKDVDKDKSFIITFSQNINSKEDVSKYIKVYDSNRNLISCEFMIEGNKVKVTPKESYESKKTYTMEISNKITSAHGKELSKNIVMKFTVK